MKAAIFLREKCLAEEFVEIERDLRQIREEIQLETMVRKEGKDPGYVH
ncbi:MAG: hypothetical protein JSW70_08430 [Syntrophobacterales bacterium]|nr:MAG: hypothetical protein JSW70_08430 [Syntrophobacterales bacterium]